MYWRAILRLDAINVGHLAAKAALFPLTIGAIWLFGWSVSSPDGGWAMDEFTPATIWMFVGLLALPLLSGVWKTDGRAVDRWLYARPLPTGQLMATRIVLTFMIVSILPAVTWLLLGPPPAVILFGIIAGVAASSMKSGMLRDARGERWLSLPWLGLLVIGVVWLLQPAQGQWRFDVAESLLVISACCLAASIAIGTHAATRRWSLDPSRVRRFLPLGSSLCAIALVPAACLLADPFEVGPTVRRELVADGPIRFELARTGAMEPAHYRVWQGQGEASTGSVLGTFDTRRCCLFRAPDGGAFVLPLVSTRRGYDLPQRWLLVAAGASPRRVDPFGAEGPRATAVGWSPSARRFLWRAAPRSLMPDWIEESETLALLDADGTVRESTPPFAVTFVTWIAGDRIFVGERGGRWAVMSAEGEVIASGGDGAREGSFERPGPSAPILHIGVQGDLAEIQRFDPDTARWVDTGALPASELSGRGPSPIGQTPGGDLVWLRQADAEDRENVTVRVVAIESSDASSVRDACRVHVPGYGYSEFVGASGSWVLWKHMDWSSDLGDAFVRSIRSESLDLDLAGSRAHVSACDVESGRVELRTIAGRDYHLVELDGTIVRTPSASFDLADLAPQRTTEALGGTLRP